MCLLIACNTMRAADAPGVYRPVPKENQSEFARGLEYVGPVFPEESTKKWHIWGCSPIDGPDGRTHLFCARWPLEQGHYKGWQTHSEIAHAVADRPEGPFRFVDVVIQGQGGDKWNAQAPHNPTIQKVGNRYALFYIARTKGGTPKDQRIGLLLADALDGPWKAVGDEPILSPSDDKSDWDHDSRVGVNNPAFLVHPSGQCWLYYKAVATEGGARRMGLAIADRVEGPYKRLPKPVASTGTEIEDGYAFHWNGRFYLLTTDNHGVIKKGGGLLFDSDDGRKFGTPLMGFDTLAGYPGTGVTQELQSGVDPKLRKFERPQVLMRNDRPAYLYVTSGKNFPEGRGSNNYVLRVKPNATRSHGESTGKETGSASQ
jgi:hypothetical protein